LTAPPLTISSPRVAASRPATTSPVLTPTLRPTFAPCRPSTLSAKEPKRSRTASVRLRNAEDGEHGVPRELLGRAAEALDLGVDQVEELPQELAEVLRVEQLANRARAREVGEEDGDDTPFLPLVGGVRGRASVLAQGEAAGETESRGRRLLDPVAGAGPVKRRAA
jgi:hypothetical protein